ncbi:MAG: CBS domain-containing protein, partial [ANME-2 cluster archaeon]|nr:CBS domain-containing protein [ANME-2 cluster archaeon]
MQLKEIMKEPVTIDKSDKLSHALDIMDKHDTRRLLVMHNNQIQGIVTMRSITKQLGTRKKANLPASAMHVATAATDKFSKVLPDMSVNDGVVLMVKNDGILLVIDNNEVMGWVTPQEVIEKYPFNNSMVRDVMRHPITIGPEERVIHARRLMLDNDIGRLPVLENGELVGIITEHDIANGLRAFRDLVEGSRQDNRIKNLLVEDIMSRGVVSAQLHMMVKEAVALMLDRNLGGLPVLNEKEAVTGLITRRCLLE